MAPFPTDPAVLLRAIAFAARKHRLQRRKDTEASPYINHPIAVAELLAVRAGVTDQATLVAALLHDTIEDTNATRGELAREFGREVASLVAEVSDDKSLRKKVRKRLQVEHAPRLSGKAKRIKLADKTCNVSDIADSPPMDWPARRRMEYLYWAETVVAGCRGVDDRLEGLFDAALARARAAVAASGR